MADSVESKSEKVDVDILSKLADDDYLQNKVNSMKQQVKLSKSNINYIIRNAKDTISIANSLDIDDLVNKIIKDVIYECENNIEDAVSEEDTKSISEKDNLTEQILKAHLTIDNYEKLLGLTRFKAFELPFSSDENIRSIRYKGIDGITYAIAQINTDTNKLRLQTFSGALPKQEFINPQQVNYRIMSKSKTNNWSAEYGGVNQFDGSIEIRYKDNDGHVMAAVIFKSDGNVDTVVEYQYENGKKTQMLHTSQYGHSKTIYDDKTDTTKLVIDIDTDGNICCITRGFDK